MALGSFPRPLGPLFPTLPQGGSAANEGSTAAVLRSGPLVPVIDWVRELASEGAAPLGTALLDVAEHLSESGSWACELATGKITCSKNLFRILELSSDDSRVDVAELLAHVHPDDRNRL